MDPYAALGVNRDATPAEVKAAFQSKLKALGESKPQESVRAERKKLLQKAFAVLFDPKAKARYDQHVAAAAAAMRPVPPPQAEPKSFLGILAAVVVIGGALAGGWYVKYPLAAKKEQERKEAAALKARPRDPVRTFERPSVKK